MILKAQVARGRMKRIMVNNIVGYDTQVNSEGETTGVNVEMVSGTTYTIPGMTAEDIDEALAGLSKNLTVQDLTGKQDNLEVPGPQGPALGVDPHRAASALAT